MLTRRAFLGSAAALAASPGLPRAAEAPRVLRAAAASAQLAPAGQPATPVWAYDGAVPGPLLRIPQGGRVRVELENALPQPTTIHWHGVRVENAMDGVPHLTQEAVAPGGRFLYDFAAPDAGTFWYHSHERSFEQVARGLHGVLVVDEAEPPAVDRDEVLVLDDWRLTTAAEIAGGFGAMMDLSHAGRIGNWVTVNGGPEARLPVRRNARLRLRLVNVATARIFDLSAQGLVGAVVALDGQPLAAPEPLERLRLAPAQRADLIVDVTAEDGGEALLVSHERDGGYALAAFPVRGEARAAPAGAIAALPANPVPSLPDLAGVEAVPLVMEGGAMGSMASARHDGREMELRELVGRGMAWSLNGVAGMPHDPLFEAPRGRPVRMRLVNDTAWPHGIHLHGHHFRRVDGPAPGPLRDTILLERAETAEIAFVADNPGDWMIHCHMLDHAEAGMMSWFRVRPA